MLNEYFPNVKCLLCPDIVFYISNICTSRTREGVLLCLRNDLEKTMSESFTGSITNILKSSNLKYKYETTILNKSVSPKTRNHELHRKWKIFSASRLVITDRLHAMIFSAITGTPCLAFDNKSKKVSGSYKWIEDVPYIKFAEDLRQAQELISELYSLENCTYKALKLEFSKLKNLL
jgi:pyruvyl transferase EpsI